MKKTALMTLITVAITVMGVFTSYANTIENEVKNRIESLDKTDLKSWFIQYKEIQTEYSDRLDPDETVYDYVDASEFDFICRIVQAEAGICDWGGKVHVANVIVNRYRNPEFPNTFTKVLKQKRGGSYQFTTYANGAYKTAKVCEDTILAVEFAFQMPDTTDGALYFHSGKSLWHKNNLEFIFDDGKHKFYR